MTLIFDEEEQKKKLKQLYAQEGEDLAQLLAQKYALEYTDLGIAPIDMDALRIVEQAKAKTAASAAFNIVGTKLDLGVLSPEKKETKELIQELISKGYTVTIFVVSKRSLEKAWERYEDLSYATESKAGSLDISNQSVHELLEKIKTLEDVIKLVTETLASKGSNRISHGLEVMVAGALATGASDIHLEPEESYTRLRFRLDGVLNNILHIDPGTYALLLSRIKLLSGLKLNIQSEAQDGRFSVTLGDSAIEIRTSILPGAYRESIVMRILNPKSISVPIEELGIEPALLGILMREIARPEGMLLTTGPTGSGKTTTLYAFLKKIHTPDIKIITIEDPIEYHLPGIVQTQVETEKNYTFLSGLRSALRQDPDVIMVGEIRDNETAEIAVTASLTGHFVFSTLHTNNAAGTFPRLIDLGVNPKILTSAIRVSMAQRLVRKLCTQCRKEIKIAGEALAEISRIEKNINQPEYKDLPRNKMFVAVGCPHCHNTGYKGRIGIYEAIVSDAALEKVLLSNPSEREIRKSAAPQGILSMREDGIIKILKGITTLEELKRVINLDTDV